jgi:hypothetical protein
MIKTKRIICSIEGCNRLVHSQFPVNLTPTTTTCSYHWLSDTLGSIKNIELREDS